MANMDALAGQQANLAKSKFWAAIVKDRKELAGATVGGQRLEVVRQVEQLGCQVFTTTHPIRQGQHLKMAEAVQRLRAPNNCQVTCRSG